MSTREYRVALQVREDLHPLASVSADQRWFWTERHRSGPRLRKRRRPASWRGPMSGEIMVVFGAPAP